MYDVPALEALEPEPDVPAAPPLLLDDPPGVLLLPLVAEPGVEDDDPLDAPAAPVELITLVSMYRSADAAPAPVDDDDPVELDVPLPVVPTAALPPCRHPLSVTVLAVLPD